MPPLRDYMNLDPYLGISGGDDTDVGPAVPPTSGAGYSQAVPRVSTTQPVVPPRQQTPVTTPPPTSTTQPVPGVTPRVATPPSAPAPLPNPTSPDPSFLTNGQLNPAKLQEFISYGFDHLSPTSTSLDSILQSLAGIGVQARRATHAGNQPSDDKIQLPDGTIIDLIQDVGGPGAHWQYSVDGPGGGGTGGGGVGGGTGLSGMGSEFTDPWGALLENLVKNHISTLGNTPVRQALTDYMTALKSGAGDAKTRAAALSGVLGSRADELTNTPAYSDQQSAIIKTKAFDQFERRRQETLKNDRMNVYARGFEPTSGIIEDQTRADNERFDQARGQTESDILLDQLRQTEGRKDQALNLRQLATSVLNGGDATSLGDLSQVADLENQIEQDQLSRESQQITSTQAPLALIDSRSRLANSLTTDPSSSISSLMGLLQLAQGQSGINTQNSLLQGQGWAQALQTLLAAFGGR